jgi:hypothetical protein
MFGATAKIHPLKATGCHVVRPNLVLPSQRRRAMLRLLSGLLGAFYALTGLFILLDGHRFYELPDVIHGIEISRGMDLHVGRTLGAVIIPAILAIIACIPRAGDAHA